MRRSFGSLILLIVTTAAGCSSESRTAVSAQQASPPGRAGGGNVPVTVGRVVRKSMPLDLRVIGSVEPASTVEVHAQVTGQLTSIGFKEGDEVKQGDVLFTLDRRPLEAALKQAEANLQRDVAQSANAEVQAQRLTDLAQRGIVSRDQLDTSKATAAALAGTIEADRAAVENARIQLQYTTITAPITGRTGALMVHTGSLLRANDVAAMVIINQLDPINVIFSVPEARLSAVKGSLSGNGVSISAEPPSDPRPSVGRLVFLDNAVDQTTGTIKAKGSFPNADHRLWPGQYVNITMTLGVDRDAIVVPTPAVQAGPDGPYVFVIKGDQTAELRSVQIGRASGSETIIAAGLAADETVVIDGQLRLTPGARVTIKTANTEKAGS
jgi:multidrug efflux system membrane fusion protein